MVIDFAKELNAEQLRVVTDGDGPCLVLAGAGSGKTRTIVYRVAWLLEHGIDPRSIMLVTFTNKAAKEMLTRVDTLTAGKSRGLFGGTFHHLGNLFLRRGAGAIGRSPSFSILDADDSERLMKSVIPSSDARSKLFPKPSVLAGAWSFARNSGANLEEYIGDRFGHLPSIELEQILASIHGYEARKQSANAMDFDDLLIHWRALLQSNGPHNGLRYVLVDEYQDTNVIQGDIVRLLAAPHQNLLVVGDDSQSIYSFRAATVQNILAFPKHYEGAKTFRLETNYRSTPEILSLANESIRHNHRRHEKTLKSVKKQGRLPELAVHEDTEHEARAIAQSIIESHAAGAPWRSHAVLFRAAYQALELELACAKLGIPYVMRGGVRFFEQAHVKDVLAYFRILANPLDELAWKRVLLMEEGVGEVKADRIWQGIRQHAAIEHLTLNIDQGLMFHDQLSQLPQFPANTRVLLRDLVELKDNVLAKGVLTILQNGYSDYLESNFENHKDRRADLEQLATFASRYTTLEEFLADASLSEGFRRDRAYGITGPEDAVVLSTIHQAKGLEWDHVHVLGLVDGQFPHERASESTHEIEEERRLFYVAVTRAADQLTLSYPIQSKNAYQGFRWNEPSRFLTELPDHVFTRRELTASADGGGRDDEDTIELSSDGEVVNKGILDRIIGEKRRTKR